ncbi:MAG: ATP-binding protein [Chloroflexota bacterium]|nr:ATP-binding protein [Chloroflexota bacterium]
MNMKTQRLFFGGTFVALVGLALLAVAQTTVTNNTLTPHGYCLLWEPALVRVLTISDLLIGLSYMSISSFLVYFVYKTRHTIPFERIFLLFGAFIFFCGITHFMNIITIYTAAYWWEAGAKVLTAGVSVITALSLPPLAPRILKTVRAARLSESRRQELSANNRRLEIEIAERMRIEGELRAALLRETELNGFRQNFVVRVSHEFRTPLSIVRSSSDLLKNYADRMPPEQRAEKLEQIQTEVTHLTRLLDDILLVGRLESEQQPIRLATLDLDALCGELVNEARTVAGAHDIVYTPSERCAPVQMDAQIVRQILNNLLSNAIKYSPSGSVVRLSLACADGWARFVVRDEGIGILPEEMPRIFDPFYRGTNFDEIAGTGLGLAIVKQAAAAHDGTVSVESGVGQGTTFTVRLPLRGAAL